MVYDSILLDVFNLTYRKGNSRQNATQDNPIKIAEQVISYIESDIKGHLKSGGNLYFLFDPLPEILKSDMGMSKNFKYSITTRKTILKTYKANRKYDPKIIEALKLIRRYYTFRGENIKICICRDLEADDFVEGILKFETGKIALYSNDSDWARYITDDIVMIKKDFENPYTKEDYKNENGIYPSIASVTFKKSVFGDITDGIESIFDIDKVEYPKNIKEVSENALKYISENNITLEEIKKTEEMLYTQLLKRKDENALIEFFYILKGIQYKNESPQNRMQMNLRVIKSRCDDVKKYITWKEENKELNEFLENLIFKKKKEKSFSFGKVKI